MADAGATSRDSGGAGADVARSTADREPNPLTLEITRGVRQRGERQRQHAARARMDAAAQRDQLAQARDVAALARDQAAAARDLALTQLYAVDEQDADAHLFPGAGAVGRAAAARTRAAQRRTLAAEHLALAVEDRQAAAYDRERAAGERHHALADREALARQAASVETDALTGARPRAAGMVDLVHELDRCSRTSDRLVIAYVEVVGARLHGGGETRAADEELLRRTVAHIHEHLRSYDLIIRLGVREFLCVMSSMTLPGARERFVAIATATGADAIATGFAALTAHETATELIARAGNDLSAALGASSTTDRGPRTR